MTRFMTGSRGASSRDPALDKRNGLQAGLVLEPTTVITHTSDALGRLTDSLYSDCTQEVSSCYASWNRTDAVRPLRRGPVGERRV